MTKAPLNIAIGFATGRKAFQRVLRTYVYNWQEAGLIADPRIRLHLFVAYDLSYNNTEPRDYTHLQADLVERIESSTMVRSGARNESVDRLVQAKAISSEEAFRLFGHGYAAQRNAILHSSINRGMDYLLFLDDDEYPVAVAPSRKAVVWEGQHVLETHLKHIAQADITHGHHCGYISPIPHMEFDDTLTQEDFRCFIGAISNDIVNWSTVKTIMDNGGVTYAEPAVLTTDLAVEVEEAEHSKFISGSNLCINLTQPRRVLPFFNPPGARGEDSLLGTCLGERTVLKVPCYTFHDGFGTYDHLLHGVLPLGLKFIKADTEDVVARFYRACVGWVRYKPLLLYVSRREEYAEIINRVREDLTRTLPKLCTHFRQPRFMSILTELEKYDRKVEKHYRDFGEAQMAWAKIMEYVASTK